MEFLKRLWRSFEGPLEELVVHFAITVVTILSISGIELLLTILHLADHPVPFLTITLSEWMFGLDVLAATLINLVGIYRALKELFVGENGGS